MYWQIQDLLVFHQFYTSTLLSDNGQHIGRVSAAIATEISADSRSICQPSLGWHLGWCIRQYVDRHMVVISAESWLIYSAEICWPKTVECQSICLVIYISWGLHKIHSHDPKRDLTSSAQTLLIGETESNQPQSNQINSNQMLTFGERRKPEYPEKNFSEQSREPTNSTHYNMMPGIGFEPRTHWWKTRTLTTLPPCSPKEKRWSCLGPMNLCLAGYSCCTYIWIWLFYATTQ